MKHTPETNGSTAYYRAIVPAVTVAILVLWFALLAVPVGWTIDAKGPLVILTAAAITWFLLNVYTWMIPNWRTMIVQRRGPLLGFGFAFAAALISAIIDGAGNGIGAGIALFGWRLLLFGAPFIVPFLRPLSPYPHPLDLGVTLYALALPLLPGAGSPWATLLSPARPGFFSSDWLGLTASPEALVLGPGHLAAVALLFTYFFGARVWTAAPLDWVKRQGDWASVGRMAALGAFGAWLVPTLYSFAVQREGAIHLSFAPHVPHGSAALAWVFMGLTLAPLFEELVFRSILVSGLRHIGSKGRMNEGVSYRLTVVLAVALIQAWVGSFGLTALASFGFSLGISWGYLRSNRLFPAVLGHALGWLLLLAFAAV